MEMDEVYENLWVGTSEEAVEFVKHENQHAICVLEGLPSEFTLSDVMDRVIHIPILVPTLDGYEACTERLDAVAMVVNGILSKGHKVMIFCAASMERSPLSCAWFLYKQRGYNWEDAYMQIVEKHGITQRRDSWVDWKARQL